MSNKDTSSGSQTRLSDEWEGTMRSELVAFLLAAATGATLAGESVGNATTYRSMHASNCTTVYGSSNVTWANNGQLENKSTTDFVEAWCAMPHDSYLPLNFDAGGVATLNVYGNNTGCHGGGTCNAFNGLDCSGVSDGTSQMCARACDTYRLGSGGACSAWKGDGGTTGAVTIQPAIGAWTVGANYDNYFVDVYLCIQCNSVDNAYWGSEVQL